MFDMGWWELGIVGLIMILVLGPKELPHAMRTIARFMRKARRLAGEFQGHMDDLVREADLAEVRNTVQSIKNKDIGSAISQAVDPSGELTRDLDATMQDAKKEMNEIKSSAGPRPSSAPASVAAQATTAKPEESAASSSSTSTSGTSTTNAPTKDASSADTNAPAGHA